MRREALLFRQKQKRLPLAPRAPPQTLPVQSWASLPTMCTPWTAKETHRHARGLARGSVSFWRRSPTSLHLIESSRVLTNTSVRTFPRAEPGGPVVNPNDPAASRRQHAPGDRFWHPKPISEGGRRCKQFGIIEQECDQEEEKYTSAPQGTVDSPERVPDP